MQVLRPFQSAALDGLRDRLRAGKRRLVLVSPTGSGKTTIASAMIHGAVAKGGSVLFLSHRKELTDQCSARLDEHEVPHGVIMSGHPRVRPWEKVQVASIQTLTARMKRGLPAATVIVLDECHHSRSDSYETILAQYPDAVLVGLTATPWRKDGLGLGTLFDDVVVAATPRELIAQGFLVPYTGFVYDAPELDRVKVRAAEYDAEGSEKAMRSSALCGNIVGQYIAHSAGKRAVVFCVSIAHSQFMVAQFEANGIRAEHVDGTMSKAEREGVFRRFARGETLVLCNCNVATEGWDCPPLETVILARPTKSLVLALQMIGRGLRTSPGKTICRIHDHAGVIPEHGLPDADRDYSLNADTSKKSASVDPLKTCKQCFAIYPGGKPWPNPCPYCKFVEPKPETPEVEVVDHAEVRAIPLSELPVFQNAPIEKQRSMYQRWVAQGRERGYKPKFAAAKFFSLFHRWPPKEWSL